jgi:hypothetical protein
LIRNATTFDVECRITIAQAITGYVQGEYMGIVAKTGITPV